MFVSEMTMLELAGKVPGMMPEADLRFLYKQAGNLPPDGLWIEIGSWKGRSLAAVVLGARAGAQVVAVDTWLGSQDEMSGTAFAEAAKGDGPFQEFNNTVKGVRFLRPEVKVGCMRTFSTVAASLLQAKSADVVFLDGTHDYKGFVEDLRAWRRVLKDDGVLCGHDRQLPGVTRGLRDEGLTVQEGGECIWWVEASAKGSE